MNNPELRVTNRAAEEELQATLREQAKRQRVESFQHHIRTVYKGRKADEQAGKDTRHQQMVSITENRNPG